MQCQLYFAPSIAFYSRRKRNKLEKQVFQPRGTHKELRPSNTAPFCFAPPLWKPSFSKMTDLAGNSDENSAIEALSEASKQPSELDVEGKHFGQALLADQSFIQAISTAVMSGLSMNSGTPHCSVSRTELIATKRPAGVLYGPGEVLGKFFDSTAASVQAKHDFPFQWENFGRFTACRRYLVDKCY